MILFDWGTYNAFSELPIAAALGTKLTEIPPYDFARRSRGEDYFQQYREFASKAFTTVTAHAPYRGSTRCTGRRSSPVGS